MMNLLKSFFSSTIRDFIVSSTLDHSTLSHSFQKYQAGLKLKNEPFSNKKKQKKNLKLQKKWIKCVSKEKKNQKPYLKLSKEKKGKLVDEHESISS